MEVDEDTLHSATARGAQGNGLLKFSAYRSKRLPPRGDAMRLSLAKSGMSIRWVFAQALIGLVR
jgi:hypothetical protein